MFTSHERARAIAATTEPVRPTASPGGDDRVSHLLSARELTDFRLGDDRTDIRRWPVFTNDARMVGAVDRLLVEAATGKVRYASVSLARNAESDERPTTPGSVLVPIGLVRRLENREAIVLHVLKSDQLARAPRLLRRAITRADEDTTLAVYGMATSHELPRQEMYCRPLFDERCLALSVVE